MSTSDQTQPWATVFVAVPSLPKEQREVYEFALDTTRRAAQNAGRESRDPWTVEVTHGRLAPTDEPAAIRRSIRRKLVSEGDAVIGLLSDGSFGCGREAGWAVGLGIPILLVHKRGLIPTPHAGGTPPEATVDVRDYASPSELYNVVYDWMKLRRPQILAGRIRRSRQLAVTEPLRFEVRDVWQHALSGERRRICDALLVSEAQVEALLSNDLDFAATRIGLTLDLAAQMGIVRTTHARHHAQRGPDSSNLLKEELDGLDDAIDTWDWDGPTTARAVRLRLGLAERQRECESGRIKIMRRAPSLTTRFAWKKLIDGDPRPRRTSR